MVETKSRGAGDRRNEKKKKDSYHEKSVVIKTRRAKCDPWERGRARYIEYRATTSISNIAKNIYESRDRDLVRRFCSREGTGINTSNLGWQAASQFCARQTNMPSTSERSTGMFMKESGRRNVECRKLVDQCRTCSGNFTLLRQV